MTLHTHQHPPTPTGTQCRYLPDFEIFKGIFLGTSRADSNSYGDICPDDICPGNICPGDICPYQEYLSCYRLYFDQTLKVDFWDHLIPTVIATFIQVIFVLATFVHIRNISAVTDLNLTKLQKYVPGTHFYRFQLYQ